MRFRQATPDDILFISRGFHSAMLMDDVPEDRIKQFAENVCMRTDVLYSWKNTIIAEEEIPVGMVTVYDGNHYHEMKEITFTLVKNMWGIDYLAMDDEALPGEYYIDSLSVLSSFRGKGIGTALLRNAISKAAELSIPNVTIAVDPINERAQKLYQSLGFKRTNDIFIFGHTYWKMTLL